MSEQNKKKRNIRFGDRLIRVPSKKIKFNDLYEEFGFATTKLNDVHYIFESTSGYIVGQGENYTRARNNSKFFLEKTNGRFNELIDLLTNKQ
jgi:hypothetical protein